MAQEPAKVHSINSGTATAPTKTTPDKPERSRAKPKYALPTERITCEKQLNLLRAYSAVSGPNKKPVKIDEVAEVSKIGNATISMANAFFVEAGLLLKSDAGFLPSESVSAFALAHQWGPETAAQKLAPTIRTTWFAERVIPKLMMGKTPEKELYDVLAMEATVGPDFKPRIKLLLDFLEESGIAERDGEFVNKGPALSAASAATPAPAPEKSTASSSEPKETPQRDARSAVNTAFTQMTGGAVQFNIAVKVDMDEFAGWKADRIAAFFGGIAQVLSAKAAVEKAASKDE